jgi:hypothetical protein
MRGMLFLFKGTPSASPYRTWVNDPRDSEELPPDWTPEEPALQPLPDGLLRTADSVLPRG